METISLQDSVDKYFRLIHDIREGDRKAVPALMEMWDPDGIFDFAGSPPVVGTFKGIAAIRTLYQNRVAQCGMELSLEAVGGKSKSVALGKVDTEVTHVRVNGNRAIATWRTVIGTKDGRGFDVAGSHAFTFEHDKIKSLRVTVSPKAEKSQLADLKMEDLTVSDIGRLSLAAWPVV
jgi:ketosteroid isomerase-like protein